MQFYRHFPAIAAAAILMASGAVVGFAATSTAADAGPVLYGCVPTTGGSGTEAREIFNVHRDAPNTKCPAGSFLIIWQGQAVPGPTPTPSPSSTSSSPSPSPSTSPSVSPSPSPTTTSPVATACPSTAPKYELTALTRAQTPPVGPAAGGNDNGAVVRQEVWNPSSKLTEQDTKVWSSSQWCSEITAAAGNTAVNSYPDVSNTVTDTSNQPIPITRYTQLSSTYSEQMHATAGTDAEAAYDIWLARPGGGYDYELMIWVDNHGQQPICCDRGVVTFGGVSYHEWLESTAQPNTTCGGGECTISLVQDNAETGTADIKAIVNGLVAQGYYPADIGINQIDFGFETPSTGGQPEVFEVDQYSLTAAGSNI